MPRRQHSTGVSHASTWAPRSRVFWSNLSSLSQSAPELCKACVYATDIFPGTKPLILHAHLLTHCSQTEAEKVQPQAKPWTACSAEQIRDGPTSLFAQVVCKHFKQLPLRELNLARVVLDEGTWVFSKQPFSVLFLSALSLFLFLKKKKCFMDVVLWNSKQAFS